MNEESLEGTRFFRHPYQIREYINRKLAFEKKNVSIRDSINRFNRSIIGTVCESDKTSSSSFHRVIARDSEKAIIKDSIKLSLEKGEGSVVYICGSPGLGKTATVMEVIKDIKSEKGQKFDVIGLLGTAYSDSNSLFTQIVKELNLSNNVKDKTDPKNILGKHFRSRPNVLNDESVGSHKVGVNMTVVVIDEIDLCKKEILNELFGWASTATSGCQSPSEEIFSSLVVVGIGNNVNLSNDSAFSHFIRKVTTKVVFTNYSSDQLQEILRCRTGDLFDKSSSIMLVGKVLSLRNGTVVFIYRFTYYLFLSYFLFLIMTYCLFLLLIIYLFLLLIIYL